MCPRADSSRTGERAAALAAADVQVLASALAIAPADPAGVHEARKSVRRLRSLLQLGRRALGRDAVDAIDLDLRLLAGDLSALRDGQVVQDTARQMVYATTDPGDRANWDALLALLVERQQQRLADTLHDDPGFMRRQAQAHRQAERLQQLRWHRLHADDLRHALERSIRRQARAEATALTSGNVDDLHDWRRRSRRLRMQLSALRKLHVRPHGDSRDTLSLRHVAKLVDQLGALQDLALLSQALEALEPDRPRARPAASRRARTPSPIQPLA
ncbi:CHAD domain-containing protein [Pseudoxanthomonas sp. PXM02]|uniref:CHAD domain-containing protein n=1 Tax=Pseudoxanthomonas sp. PXM02 TaxID=2769294 RepID=UPI00177DBDF7|nr:CHAD domain-containing protein [Pseudoxanthomonas sp. PXM02]MBD9480278.1 CHAD domain-containing protein [Pseudoxanthomonas sp. PXM02]